MPALANDLDNQENLDEAFDFLAEDDEAFDDEAIHRHSFASRFSRPGFAMNLAPNISGVQSATLTTPRGNASVRLPEPVVTERAFREAIGKLETTLQGLSSDVSSTGRGLQTLSVSNSRAHRGFAGQQRQLAKVTKESIARLKKQQSTQSMMSLLVLMMLQKDQQQKLAGHTHEGGGGVAKVAEGGNSSMMMLLPMMMMPNSMSGGGGDNNMMMFFLMMSMMGGMK